jgi:tRNA-Thr(GGU) m(6)t(6)A37 methyltransferase TsaA
LTENTVEALTLQPIGFVRSPHVEPADTPVQPRYARGVRGAIEVLPQYEEGLEGIERFSHICVVFQFDRAGPWSLTVVPHGERTARGVFATRAPRRPNPIGVSVVRLLGRDGRVLTIEGVDMLDGTPVLDIKPHVEPTEQEEV